MIDKTDFDPIHDAVDQFESSWTFDSRTKMPDILSSHGLSGNCEALAELIRVDMDLRFMRGKPSELDEYLAIFGESLSSSDYLSEVAYEDYRLRSRYGLPVTLSRWQKIPNIQKAKWYQDLRWEAGESDPPAPSEFSQNDPIVKALETIGFFPIQQLGEGQESVVYLATQNELAGRYVVLKVIDSSFACEPQNMALLQHTNIVPIFSFHRLAGKLVICMPYSGRVTLGEFYKRDGVARKRAGESLCKMVHDRVEESLIRRDDGSTKLDSDKPINPKHLPAADDRAVLLPLENLRHLDSDQLAIWMFQRITAGLAHSHMRGVVHGDLKPENILIRNDGEPALLDFNLSSSAILPNQFIGGTLPYMSPEGFEAILVGKGEPSPCSDVYSVGVLIYEFVTGRPPYPVPASDRPEDLKEAIAARKQSLEWKTEDRCSVGLRRIIEKCLNPDSAFRYQTAELLEKDLQLELNHLPLESAKEPRTNRARKWFQRHPSAASTLSITTVLAAVIVGLSYWGLVHRAKTTHNAAISFVQRLDDRTSRSLTKWMVDPQRQRDQAVDEVCLPLTDLELINGGPTTFDASSLTTEEHKQYERVLWRYIGQISFIELRRLRGKLDHESLLLPESADLHRIDQLIELSKQLDITSDSFALKCIESQRKALENKGQEELVEQDLEKLSSDERYLQAVRRMTGGRLADAIELLEDVDDEGLSGLRLTLLGRSLMDKGEHRAASLAFTRALEHAPESGRLYHARGLCYLGIGDPISAQQDFNRTISIEPDHQFALVNRGVSRMNRHRYDRAIDDFTTVLKTQPKNVMVYLKRSAAFGERARTDFAEKGDKARSNADYQTAISLSTNHPKTLIERATARRDRGDIAGATIDYELALKSDRLLSEIYYRIASMHSSQLEHDKAYIWYTKSLDINPEFERARIDRARLLAFLKKPKEAIKEAKIALEKPNAQRTIYQASCVYALAGQPINAARYLARAITRGYSFDFSQDSDLDSIRASAEYGALEIVLDLANEDIVR